MAVLAAARKRTFGRGDIVFHQGDPGDSLKVLVPRGKGATIGRLLKHHGYRVVFGPPSTGRLVIGCYQVPKGARLATAKRKPKLVASVTVTIRRVARVKVTIKLTALGERLLTHSRTMKLTGKGAFTPSGGPTTTVRRPFGLTR
jgi:hypothetical protein